MRLHLVTTEYKDLSENVRHYNTIQIAMWTVFFAITGGLLKLALDFSVDENHTNLIRTLKYAGALATCVFWIRGSIYYYRQARFERRLCELERIWGFRHYLGLIEATHRKIRPGRIIAHLFFIAILAFWMMSIAWPKFIGF